VKDAILTADTNEYIADCYNYYGNNPSYNPQYANCRALFRAGDILGVNDITNASGDFPTLNGGSTKTAGVDVNVNWGTRVGPGRLDLALHLNYLLSYKSQTVGIFPNNEFKGTIPYFGAGFGQAFPELKANLSARYQWAGFAFDARARFIDKMANRNHLLGFWRELHIRKEHDAAGGFAKCTRPKTASLYAKRSVRHRPVNL
jgi:iron complex outermembrane recepter protein